jgi:carbonyl reductase 1
MVSLRKNSGQIAVVTGANKGIGYHIALQLATSGSYDTVVLACRDARRGAEALASLKFDVAASASPCSAQTAALTLFSLSLGDPESHSRFVRYMIDQHDGKCHLLINNAAIAYKMSDPLPFKEQAKPTLDVNFRGTVDFTEKMLPLLRETAKLERNQTGKSVKIVNVLSIAGYLDQVAQRRQEQFTDRNLTVEKVKDLMDEFERDVLAGTHKAAGWSSSNYGMSKLGMQAVTQVWARTESKSGILVYSCCPGYCRTDMTSNKGHLHPSAGAKYVIAPAVSEPPLPSGSFVVEGVISEW